MRCNSSGCEDHHFASEVNTSAPAAAVAGALAGLLDGSGMNAGQ